MRVRLARTRCVTYALLPSARTTTPRGSRPTSSVQSLFAVWRSTAETWCVHAEVTTAIRSSGVTAIPHASAGSGTRATSTSPCFSSVRRIRSSPGSRTVTSTRPSSGSTAAGAPGIFTTVGGVWMSTGRGTRRTTPRSSSAR